jgi:S1-C subfamily serine protease
VALSELDASLREEFQIEPNVQGLVVLGVDVGGENENVLRAGDVIEAIGPQELESMAAARAIAGRAAIGENAVVVRINRDGAITYRRLEARS